VENPVEREPAQEQIAHQLIPLSHIAPSLGNSAGVIQSSHKKYGNVPNAIAKLVRLRSISEI
jgi:hypothetical protein